MYLWPNKCFELQGKKYFIPLFTVHVSTMSSLIPLLHTSNEPETRICQEKAHIFTVYVLARPCKWHTDSLN